MFFFFVSFFLFIIVCDSGSFILFSFYCLFLLIYTITSIFIVHYSVSLDSNEFISYCKGMFFCLLLILLITSVVFVAI